MICILTVSLHSRNSYIVIPGFYITLEFFSLCRVLVGVEEPEVQQENLVPRYNSYANHNKTLTLNLGFFPG